MVKSELTVRLERCARPSWSQDLKHKMAEHHFEQGTSKVENYLSGFVLQQSDEDGNEARTLRDRTSRREPARKSAGPEPAHGGWAGPRR